jgi:hypothetical protein
VGFEGRRPAARRIATFRTSDPGWGELAIDCLLNYDDVVIEGVFVEARSLSPKVPAWRQLRRILAAHGVATPRSPPESPPWWARGVPVPTGMTGTAG